MDNNDPNNPNQTSAPGTFPPSPAQPAPNPWDAPANPASSSPEPSTNSMWPSSTDSNPALETPFSQPPLQQNQPGFAPAPAGNQNLSNPYLTPQDTSATGISQFGSGQPAAQNTEPAVPLPENPVQPVSPAPDQQDPLNTAFAPLPNQDQTNQFAPPEAPVPPSELPPQQPIQPSPDTPDTAAPIVDQPQNPVPDMGQGLPVTPAAGTPDAFDQNTQNPQIPSSNQPGALDLSQLQSNTNPSPEGTTSQPEAPLPEMNPAENAPTDLSHLIAGDEAHQQPGDIYNPPVVSDQNPAVDASSPQPAAQDGVPPPGKHLNLTKVLLVAGIPIILIVAALSAYMILGIGKPQSQSGTQTSLPIEKSNQTPLTNPPQQIVAPLPSVVPEPQASSAGLTTAPESTSSGSTLPGASSSPKSAIEQLKARQSPSPF